MYTNERYRRTLTALGSAVATIRKNRLKTSVCVYESTMAFGLIVKAVNVLEYMESSCVRVSSCVGESAYSTHRDNNRASNEMYPCLWTHNI